MEIATLFFELCEILLKLNDIPQPLNLSMFIFVHEHQEKITTYYRQGVIGKYSFVCFSYVISFNLIITERDRCYCQHLTDKEVRFREVKFYIFKIIHLMAELSFNSG